MVDAENGLKKKIRDKLWELLDGGSKVAAVKFYHEATLTPLLESKQFIDSMQRDRTIAFGDERLDEFLILLEKRDFGGAAARLLDELPGLYLPSEAIEHALRIGRLLDIDVRPLDLPPSAEIALSQIRTAQAIVYQRAELRIRERMVQNLVRQSTGSDEAETMIDGVMQSLQKSKYVRPDLSRLTFEGLDPDEHRPMWIRRAGRLAALVYGLFALVGFAVLVYSYLNIQPMTTFSMAEGLSWTEQQSRIDKWLKENLSSWPWFFNSVSTHFSTVAFEPDLPLAYEGEKWTWEERLANINASANEIKARLQRCHEVLFVLYSFAMMLASFHWFSRDIVSGLLMVLLGVLGIPFLAAQVWRSEFDHPIWLGPLLVPASVALLASILDLALVTPKTARRNELRAFWFGTLGFVISGFLLGWAILEGNHLRSGAGLGFFGGALLMARHGWRYWRCKE